MLDKLQERVCWSVGPSLTASLEAVAHHWNVVSLCFSGRYYCGKCLSKLVPLFLVLVGVPLIILMGCEIFLSFFLDVIRVTMSRVSFLAQLDFWILSLQHAFI